MKSAVACTLHSHSFANSMPLQYALEIKDLTKTEFDTIDPRPSGLSLTLVVTLNPLPQEHERETG